mgnify:FL=1|tara:strand:+ start:154 stop:633 length:480 start_codon:yes stop_codon:yes gene_type:complete
MKKKKSTRISKYVSYNEGVRSSTAARLGIVNTPPEDILKDMKEIAAYVFEPLRRWVEGPVKITSFYRCEELNRAIGGSTSSQHCKGQAMDLDDTFGFKTNAEMFDYIKNNVKFDQLIWEFGDDNNPDWIHVSYTKHRKNRGKILRASRKDGRTVYTYMQ